MEKQKILQLSAVERSVQYLAGKLGVFLRRGERVLICFPVEKESDLGSLFLRAVEMCGAVPIVWGEDHRWKTLLRKVFDCRAGTLIAPPLVILGLTKLARATATPMNIRNVVTAGYPCTEWMIEGIRNGLDCRSWGCFDVLHEAVVAGFSCRESRGVHINGDEFAVSIHDAQGNAVPDGTLGAIVLRSRRDGGTVRTCDRGRIHPSGCKCGSSEQLLVDLSLRPNLDPELLALSNSINRWTSVLDCRLERSPAGLEIEIVVFPGEKLPRLPSCAKLVVRPWDPETDEPFYVNVQKDTLT